MSKTVDDIWRMPETPTRDLLAAEGFSDSIIDRFFRPFLGGIFFDRDLGTSSRLTMFVMKMLASGSNCLPEDGIGAIAAQLAGRLPEGCVRCTEAPRGSLSRAARPGCTEWHELCYAWLSNSVAVLAMS